METPDGDFFDVDTARTLHKKRGLVIMTHGLEASSASGLSVDMARSFLSRGFDVACVNFRGCGGEPNRLLAGYHLGFTEDLTFYLEKLRERGVTEEFPVYISGFSLGANVALKFLGELGVRAKDFNIRGAAVTGAPFDVSRHYLELEKPGVNTLVYTNSLLKSMKSKAKLQYEARGGNVPFDYERVKNATKIATIEDAYVAPLFGFESNFDYYEKSSCGQFLRQIAVPTLVVNARDDPFFNPEVEPEKLEVNPVNYVRTEKGGHLGFLFQRDRGEWEGEEQGSSWMPRELGRFLVHVDRCLFHDSV